MVDVLQKETLTQDDSFGNLPTVIALNLQAVSRHGGIAMVL